MSNTTDVLASGPILHERHGPLLIVTLNRPHAMNSLDNAAHVELGRIFDAFEADPEQRVAIVTGTGERAFCTGNDLKAASSGAPLKPADWSGGFGGITRRFGMSKPVIAAVNGWAAGGGLEIALSCDLLIASPNARFSLPEVRRGRIAGAGGVHRLPRKIPVTLAMGMLLTGRAIDAATAERWGLVNEIAEPGRLLETAERWSRDILRGAPCAVQATKQAALAGLDLPLDEAINLSPPTFEAWRNSDEPREGAMAFVEKRSPRWAEGLEQE